MLGDQEIRSSGNSLAPFVPRLALRWLAEAPDRPHRRVEGALAFVDVSGFTALTERLAARGKAGAEEVSDLVGGCFSALLEVAYDHGGDMLKWGGDAALLLFDGPDPAGSACRATWRMSRLMERVGVLRTSAGRVTLRVSAGVHAGPVDLYLVGDRHRELVVTGPAATAVAQMEAVAEAGEVVVSPGTVTFLADGAVGASKGPGFLLRGVDDEAPPPGRVHDAPAPAVDVSQLLPGPTRAHLLGGGEADEHRHAAIAFVAFSGVDGVIESEGPDGVLPSLEHIVVRAQEAAAAEGVNFHTTDVGADGGKILLLGGIPVVRGNVEERVLRAALSVVGAGGGKLSLKAGVNAGRVFMHESGPAYRRIHSFAGDAVNLAARVMGKAASGQVLATAAVLERTRSTFEAAALEPFLVKGKAEPVEASVVTGVQHGTAATAGAELPFLARRRELDQLAHAAAGVGADTGAVVEVVAEAGMGKSVLVAQAVCEWSLPTYRLACEEYGRATPYLPFRWLLRALLALPEHADAAETAAALVAEVEHRAPALAPWLPLLGDVLGVAVPATEAVEQLQPQFVRSRIEETVAAFMTAAVTTPTAIVFEDAHDLDEASLSLVAHLAASVAGRPWLLVVTRRPEGAPPLGEDPPPRLLVELDPLGATDAASLFDALAGDLALTSEERAVLVERAAGNPLFLSELVAAVRAAGSVDALPDRLEPLLAAKVDRLEPADRQVLRAAAVLGVQFDPGVVAELLETPGHSRPVDDGTWARLGEYVVPERLGRKRFSHALVRDAAYEGLSYRRRRHLHGAAATAIERRAAVADDQADLLSFHTLHAGRFGDAWRYGRVAGDRAVSVYANADAVTFFSRALEASRHVRPPQSELVTVAEALGDSAERAGRFEVAHHGYRQARRSAGSAADNARLMRKIGVIYEHQSRYAEALRAFSRGRALVTAGHGPEGVERAELAIAYAASRYRQGRFRDCISWSERAVSEAEAATHLRGLAHALYLEDQARSDMAEEPGGQALRALAIFEELGDDVGQGRVLNNLGRQSHQRGRWDEALDFYRRSKEFLARVGDVVGEAIEDYNIGEILSDQGHYEDAAELLDEARRTWRAAGYPIGVGVAISSLGRQATRTGSFEEAGALLRQARDHFATIGSSYFVLETEGRLTELAVLGGSADEATAATTAFAAQVRGAGGAKFLVPLSRRLAGIALARLGRFEQAAAELDAAVAGAEAISASFELALALAARAVVAADDGWRWAPGAVWNPAGDARRAVSLLEGLGVVDCPVMSAEDRWPGGERAQRLATTGVTSSPRSPTPV